MSFVDKKHYIVYHNRCSDGMSAAFVAKMWYEEYGIPVEFIPTNPNTTPFIENLENSHITMIDVVIPREDLIEWNKKCFKLTVLDHHETAKKALGDLPFCKFDMDECGTSMAWKFFFPHREIPWWVLYTKERDTGLLFREPENCLPWSKEVNSYLTNIPLEFDEYEKNVKNVDLNHAMLAGMAIQKAEQAQLKWILNNAKTINIQFDYDRYENVPIVNSSILQSELGNILAKESGQFAIVWYMRYDDVYGPCAQVSLRSVGDFNVANLANSIAMPNGQRGGGHKNASGFFIKMSTWSRMIGL